MSNKAEATLSAKGWLFDADVSERLDRSLAYAFAADKSQSVTFNNITSVQWIISEYGDNRIELQTQLQTAMSNYLRGKFESVEVTIQVNEKPDSAQWDIVMSGYVTNGGKRASINKLLQVKNGVLQDTFDALNGE